MAVNAPHVERLLALVRRDLGAADAFVIEGGDLAPEQPVAPEVTGSVISCLLADGRRLVVTFAAPIEDADARLRRLEMLADSFGDTLKNIPTPSRPPPALSLHGELGTLVRRAGAVDALVIDAQSPVVWGAAEGEAGTHADESMLPPPGPPPDNIVPLDSVREGLLRSVVEAPDQAANTQLDGEGPPEGEAQDTSRRAVEAVRGLSATVSLHRGGHLSHSLREDDFGFVARSFAGIYVLILVYDAQFDELRAERAVLQSLPIIERLVMALPPIDPPPPMAGAMAIRRRPRR